MATLTASTAPTKPIAVGAAPTEASAASARPPETRSSPVAARYPESSATGTPTATTTRMKTTAHVPWESSAARPDTIGGTTTTVYQR